MHRPNQPDWGDFLKTCAVLCVTLQTVLAFVMRVSPTPPDQSILAFIYAGAKFTAPAFICGILYTTIRIFPHNHWSDYPSYMANQAHALYLPALWWTLAYLIIFPQLQQKRPYHSFASFMVKIINGNAAPHLWYSTMMLQFIALMPIFWSLSHWVGRSKWHAGLALSLVTIFETSCFVLYDSFVFNQPAFHSLYWVDRIFPSFLIYAFLGLVMATYRQSSARLLPRFLVIIIPAWVFGWLMLGYRLAASQPVRFTNLPYYQPAVMAYNLVGILLICGVGEIIIQKLAILARGVHWIAVYAYRAFLSHAFWLEIIWLILGKRVYHLPVLLLLIILYFGTVLLAFASAYGFHVLRLLITKRKILSR